MTVPSSDLVPLCTAGVPFWIFLKAATDLQLSFPSFKEENHPLEAEKDELLVAPVVEDSQKSSSDNFQERRAQAIAAKAQEIEKVLVPFTSLQLSYMSQVLFGY